jgi:hypothetical protein
MNTFQVLGLAICGSFAIGVLLSMLHHRIGARVGVAWLLLWVTAGVAIARPELTVTVARALGIARGADLVFYFAILAMFIGFFAVYTKFRRVENDITTLVRQLTLREALDEHGPTEEPAHRVPDEEA